MLDWSVLIIPLAVLAIILLLPFAGCDLEDHGEALAPVPTMEKSIKLFWQGQEKEIRQISFQATVQELNTKGQLVGTPVSAPGVSPAVFPPNFLPSTGETSSNVTVEVALKYAVTATVTVTNGAWDAPGAVHFPQPLSKTFLADAEWTFNLATQTWELS